MDMIYNDGKPFEDKDSALKALEEQELSETHEPIQLEKGAGWAGVEKSPTKKDITTEKDVPTPEKVAFKDMPTKKYIIHRANVDPDNRDLPISITVNSINNKKMFWPGEEVDLNASQIGVLKDSVEEIELEIPDESGIYESKNPVALAKSYYPNMRATRSSVTGRIVMTQRIPNYYFEQV